MDSVTENMEKDESKSCERYNSSNMHMCGVCGEKLVLPRQLPCDHNLCSVPCLANLLDDSDGTITCPNCQEVHTVKSPRIQAFPINRDIMKLMAFTLNHIEKQLEVDEEEARKQRTPEGVLKMMKDALTKQPEEKCTYIIHTETVKAKNKQKTTTIKNKQLTDTQNDASVSKEIEFKNDDKVSEPGISKRSAKRQRQKQRQKAKLAAMIPNEIQSPSEVVPCGGNELQSLSSSRKENHVPRRKEKGNRESHQTSPKVSPKNDLKSQNEDRVSLRSRMCLSCTKNEVAYFCLHCQEDVCTPCCQRHLRSHISQTIKKIPNMQSFYPLESKTKPYPILPPGSYDDELYTLVLDKDKMDTMGEYGEWNGMKLKRFLERKDYFLLDKLDAYFRRDIEPFERYACAIYRLRHFMKLYKSRTMKQLRAAGKHLPVETLMYHYIQTEAVKKFVHTISSDPIHQPPPVILSRRMLMGYKALFEKEQESYPEPVELFTKYINVTKRLMRSPFTNFTEETVKVPNLDDPKEAAKKHKNKIEIRQKADGSVEVGDYEEKTPGETINIVYVVLPENAEELESHKKRVFDMIKDHVVPGESINAIEGVPPTPEQKEHDKLTTPKIIKKEEVMTKMIHAMINKMTRDEGRREGYKDFTVLGVPQEEDEYETLCMQTMTIPTLQILPENLVALEHIPHILQDSNLSVKEIKKKLVKEVPTEVQVVESVSRRVNPNMTQFIPVSPSFTLADAQSIDMNQYPTICPRTALLSESVSPGRPHPSGNGLQYQCSALHEPEAFTIAIPPPDPNSANSENPSAEAQIYSLLSMANKGKDPDMEEIMRIIGKVDY